MNDVIVDMQNMFSFSFYYFLNSEVFFDEIKKHNRIAYLQPHVILIELVNLFIELLRGERKRVSEEKKLTYNTMKIVNLLLNVKWSEGYIAKHKKCDTYRIKKRMIHCLITKFTSQKRRNEKYYMAHNLFFSL